MTEATNLAILIQVAAGLGLAACCGLRAFVPPFVIGLAVRTGVAEIVLGRPLELQASFEWISSTPALIVFGSAMVFEILADKIPAVDNLLDVVETLIRPVAGMLVVAASMSELEPLPAAVVGLLVGGPIAGTVHAVKAKTRVFSTLVTGGIASPFISIVEDGMAFFGSILAVTAAMFGLVLLFIGLVVTWRVFRMFRLQTPASNP